MKNPIPSNKLPKSIATCAGLARRMSFAPLLLGVICFLAEPCNATPGEWAYTGKLNMRRSGGTSVLLLDGRAMVVGGGDSVELYDPVTATWAVTGSLNTARTSNTTTLLADGRVLVTGGFNEENFEFLSSAELYDPATGLWTFTGSLSQPYYLHTATLLPDGKVLVVGGRDVSDAAELYDPATGTWTATGNLHVGRFWHSATLLGNGKVLVAGGDGGDGTAHMESAELYNPAKGTWQLTGSLNNGRQEHSATLLTNGKVLAAGGVDGGDYRSAELYDPITGTWTLTGSLNDLRIDHVAVLLNDGTVLIAGDFGETTELYDPATGIWSFTGNLNRGRSNHTTTLLNNGQVLVAGGNPGLFNDLDSAELYDPGTFTPTSVKGRGSIDGQTDQATFNFRVTLSGEAATGSLTFSDPAAGVSFTHAAVRNLSINGKSADFNGKANLGGGNRVTFNVSITDNGDGSSDTFSITLSNGYTANGTLTSGDIQID